MSGVEWVLIPCPFCGGGEARLSGPTCNKQTPYNPLDRAYPIVRCGCGAEVAGTDWDQSGKSAADAWNRRAIPDHLPSDIPTPKPIGEES